MEPEPGGGQGGAAGRWLLHALMQAMAGWPHLAVWPSVTFIIISLGQSMGAAWSVGVRQVQESAPQVGRELGQEGAKILAEAIVQAAPTFGREAAPQLGREAAPLLGREAAPLLGREAAETLVRPRTMLMIGLIYCAGQYIRRGKP